MLSWGSQPNFRLTYNQRLTFRSFHFPSLSIIALSGSCYARGPVSTFAYLLPFCFPCRYSPILFVYLTYSGLLVYR
ncbi:hypothetical protein C8J56DRAFT_948678 [Mycena floridula]|nr:hypothetical protein C8J56DRAFT_948678 [Mycena floridula]